MKHANAVIKPAHKRADNTHEHFLREWRLDYKYVGWTRFNDISKYVRDEKAAREEVADAFTPDEIDAEMALRARDLKAGWNTVLTADEAAWLEGGWGAITLDITQSV